KLSLADYIIVNTCGFDDIHEDISTGLFEEYSGRKKDGAKLISIGCLNRINESLRTLWPDVIFISDLNHLDRVFFNKVPFNCIDEAYLDQNTLPQLCKSDKRGFDAISKIAFHIARVIYIMGKRIAPKGSRTISTFEKLSHLNQFYVEIGRGCVSNCNYCIIKKARGGIQSRRLDQILRDIDTLYNPRQSLCLVADDCGCYGIDIGESIFTLLRAISKRYADLDVDLCYVNPLWIQRYEDEFVRLFGEVRISSVNIPMQSGSDRIVKLMNREYSIKSVIRIVNMIRQVSPQTIIWTHIIVGFPGEKDEDFHRTLSMVEWFDFVRGFTYSDRKGTASSLMENKIAERIKKSRKQRLRIMSYKKVLRRVLHDCMGLHDSCRTMVVRG
ncbi:MAG: radical SAM protein, partial [Desulfobacteraceae bacterium]|nr:radical SAM protein [Desulfobacteraceae bacterium]